MPKRRAQPARSGGQEIVGFFCGFLAGYLAAEALLARFVHPLHWLVAVLTAIIGYGAVVIWYRWRGSGGPR